MEEWMKVLEFPLILLFVRVMEQEMTEVFVGN
jgi:hypothetical protein